MLGERMVVMRRIGAPMLVVLVPGVVGMIGVLCARRIRIRRWMVAMIVRRDLVKVGERHDQGHAQPQSTMDSRSVQFHGQAKLATMCPGVNPPIDFQH